MDRGQADNGSPRLPSRSRMRRRPGLLCDQRAAVGQERQAPGALQTACNCLRAEPCAFSVSIRPRAVGRAGGSGAATATQARRARRRASRHAGSRTPHVVRLDAYFRSNAGAGVSQRARPPAVGGGAVRDRPTVERFRQPAVRGAVRRARGRRPFVAALNQVVEQERQAHAGRDQAEKQDVVAGHCSKRDEDGDPDEQPDHAGQQVARPRERAGCRTPPAGPEYPCHARSPPCAPYGAPRSCRDAGGSRRSCRRSGSAAT